MTEGCDFPDRRQSSSRDNNTYRIEVRDSGPGVPVGDVERIFEEYTSASAASDWSRGGLGLAICHRIADAHRGIVFVESKGPGATFVFMLPNAEERRIERPPLRADSNTARMTNQHLSS